MITVGLPQQSPTFHPEREAETRCKCLSARTRFAFVPKEEGHPMTEGDAGILGSQPKKASQ